MNELIGYQYALMRYMPHQESGEFVNVGVILNAPEVPYFGYRFQGRCSHRNMGFFPNDDKFLYESASCELKNTLLRFGAEIERERGTDAKRFMFEDLIKPTESILRFSPARAGASNHGNFKRVLWGLYLNYVGEPMFSDLTWPPVDWVKEVLDEVLEGGE